MKNNLISINNSSESLEKSIGIVYTNMLKNNDFYSQFDMNVFYGYNLPKTHGSLFASGTIGFYYKYMSDVNFPVEFNILKLWECKEEFVNSLVIKKIISIRNAEKILKNYDLFFKVVSRLPVQMVYPQLYFQILQSLKNIFPGVKFQFMDLSNKVMTIFNETDKHNGIYKIYGLQANGDIGIFDFSIRKDMYYERNLNHLFRSISKSIVLSGNSAIFLSQINEEIKQNSNYVIGYRKHKNYRLSREVVMEKILIDNPDAIIEPKNNLYNSYFDKFSYIANLEERSNNVVAASYRDFILSNEKILKLTKK